ncbi:MAG: transposase family protein, partial [Thioploca sp.]|nr:transposase family protein [Thioploca sp.]
KRKKNGKLTKNQKNGNKKVAKERIFVENSISGMKRYRTLVNKIRFHTIDLYDEIIGVCAGLWNFYLAN